MICEYCGEIHDGSYGSGRFCHSKCARGFATKNKRSDINEKVGKTLKGRSFPHMKENFKRKAQSPEAREKAKETKRKQWIRYVLESKFDVLTTKKQWKHRIIHEQQGLCDICGMKSEWNGKPLVFHLDHINGNNKENNRENLRCVCPNCHSQTETYAGRNQSKNGRRSTEDKMN